MRYPKVVPQIEFSKSSTLNSFDSPPNLHKSRFLRELIEAIFPFVAETSFFFAVQPHFIIKFLLENSLLYVIVIVLTALLILLRANCS